MTYLNGSMVCALVPRSGTRRSVVGRAISAYVLCSSLAAILPISVPTAAAAWHAHRKGNIGPAMTRRTTLQTLVGGAFVATTTTAAIWPSVAVPASAKNLPDSVTVDRAQTGTATTLEPVIRLKTSLEQLLANLEDQGTGSLSLDALVEPIPAQEQAFKSIFDAYSDPVSYKQKFVDQNAFLVYYTKGFDGPGRPSIEGDLPVKQTLQYGARNDAWVAWDDFLAEKSFQRKNPSESNKEELCKPLAKAIAAIGNYLGASGVRN